MCTKVTYCYRNKTQQVQQQRQQHEQDRTGVHLKAKKQAIYFNFRSGGVLDLARCPELARGCAKRKEII